MEKFKDEKTLGECRYDQKQIAIKIGLSERQTTKTFLHEICHAIFYERDLKIRHKDVYKLEQAIYYMVFHNDWVI